jgi:hypothetical protein
MLDGPILGLLYFFFGLLVFLGIIGIIFSLIYCLYKIFKYINRIRNPDYIPLPINN